MARELTRLAALKANWDAQGALPIDQTIIESARGFAEQLPDDVVPPPAVVPMAKGNLQFEWHDGPRSLELEFEDAQTIHYLGGILSRVSKRKGRLRLPTWAVPSLCCGGSPRA
jgi:hypothetical protein